MLKQLELNPNYGTGCFHRKILIDCSTPQTVLALVEDEPHAFALRLEYEVSDNNTATISAMKARWERNPTGACAGAVDSIDQLIGCPLADNVLAHHSHANKRVNCTHFFDTTGIMLRHAWKQWQGLSEPQVLYEVIYPDSTSTQSTVTLLRNEVKVLEWQLENSSTIISPEKYRGQPPVKGLTKWAVNNLSSEELEHCIILQKSLFIGASRQVDLNHYAGNPALISLVSKGVCYATQPERIDDALQLATKVEYSDCPEDMIQFEFVE